MKEKTRGDVMKLVKTSTRGQIMLPLGIRRKLGVNGGGKVIFLKKTGVLSWETPPCWSLQRRERTQG